MKFVRFMNTGPGRAIRVALGTLLIAVGTRRGGRAGRALAAFGVLPLATGATGVCPINPLLGEPLRSGTGCGRTSQ
ncbi:MAG: DUF2892 domain-containing protein [Acidimicrobiia bacterium]